MHYVFDQSPSKLCHLLSCLPILIVGHVFVSSLSQGGRRLFQLTLALPEPVSLGNSPEMFSYSTILMKRPGSQPKANADVGRAW